MEINGTVNNENTFNFDSLGELMKFSMLSNGFKVYKIFLDSSVQELILKAVEARKFAYCE